MMQMGSRFQAKQDLPGSFHRRRNLAACLKGQFRSFEDFSYYEFGQTVRATPQTDEDWSNNPQMEQMDAD
jgi:hypothetical protein